MSGQRYDPEFKDEAVKQLINEAAPSLKCRSDWEFHPTVFTNESI